jgi:hypothetical protein
MKIFSKVKTIKSKSGEVHFERWAVIETKWFAWYLHKIQQADQDHMHSHPWNFLSIILKGQYLEEIRKDPYSRETILNLKKPFKIGFFDRNWFHSIRRIVDGPIWTSVFVWGGSFAGDKWHYIVNGSCYDEFYKIPFDVYRDYKAAAKKENINIATYILTNRDCDKWLIHS